MYVLFQKLLRLHYAYPIYIDICILEMRVFDFDIPYNVLHLKGFRFAFDGIVIKYNVYSSTIILDRSLPIKLIKNVKYGLSNYYYNFESGL